MNTGRKLKRFCVVFLSFLLLSACGADQGDESDAGWNEGGSTSTGNPVSSVSFDFTGALGLALVDDSDDTGASNLKRVNPDNTLSDAVTSGTVTVLSFMVAANNQVYLLLAEPLEGCILVRVDGETHEATCVDSSLAEIIWDNAFGDPIQFDGGGNIYYEGRTDDGRTVLRENVSGETTDLINDYISLQGFLVLKDGTVFVAGRTDPTGQEWVRIITPGRSLENLLTFQVDFLALFPDDNIYYGASASDIRGVGRYLAASGNLDPVPWISEDGSGAYYDCPVESSNCGAAQSLLRTTNGRIYTSVPNGNGQNVLVQYYPVVELPDTTVADVTISKAILTYLILAGLDSQATNRLVLFETNSDTETDLLGSENIEVYHLAYLNANDRQIVMFDGLRFSDNQYVLCQVDLTDSNTLICSKTEIGKLTDFQIFNID